MEAYEETLRAFSEMRAAIQTISMAYATKVLNQTKDSEILVQDYSEKLEKALIRELNLKKILEKRDKTIEVL